MAIHYVDKSGADGAFKTLNEAARAATPGDEIVLRDGVYEIAKNQGVAGGKVALDVPNATWRAETPGRAILRGDWGPWLLSGGAMPDGSKFVGGSLHGALLSLPADGVTLDGLVIECVPCGGIDVSASHIIVRNCVTYWTRSQGLSAKKGGNSTKEADFAEDLTIEGCTFVFASAGRLDPAWVAANQGDAPGSAPRPDPAAGAVQLANLRGPVVYRSNLIAESFGEGGDVGKRAYGTAEKPILIQSNVFRNCRHAQFYINHCRHVIVRGNVSYVTEDSPLWQIPPGDAGYCYIVRDERPDLYPPSANLTFEGNVAAGGDCFQLARRGEKEFTSIVVRHNTFVSGAMAARPPVSLLAGAGVFERNVIHHTAGDVAIAAGGAGFEASENGWSRQPLRGLTSPADVTGELGLSNPDRPLRQTGLDGYPGSWGEYAANARDTFRLTDYQPLPTSSLVGVGADKVTLGALDAPATDPPEPPAVDWAALLAEIQAAVQEVNDLIAHAATTTEEHAQSVARLVAAGEQMAEINRHAGEVLAHLGVLAAKLEEHQH